MYILEYIINNSEYFEQRKFANDCSLDSGRVSLYPDLSCTFNVSKVNISRQREKVLRPILIWQLKRGGGITRRAFHEIQPRRDERRKIMARGGLKIHIVAS